MNKLKKHNIDYLEELLADIVLASPDELLPRAKKLYLALEKFRNHAPEDAKQSDSLPCKVGDMLYTIKQNKIERYLVRSITISAGNRISLMNLENNKRICYAEDIGKTFFLTQEEALNHANQEISDAIQELEDMAYHPGKKKSLSGETIALAITALNEYFSVKENTK